jgi:hypothetical protein
MEDWLILPLMEQTEHLHLRTAYPMASYLVCVAVARFNRYYRTPVNIGGINVPIVYNLIRGKTVATYNSILSAMDLQNQVLTAFSNKFGNYPYSREKHGYYEGLAGAGGMEHQTFLPSQEQP